MSGGEGGGNWDSSRQQAAGSIGGKQSGPTICVADKGAGANRLAARVAERIVVDDNPARRVMQQLLVDLWRWRRRRERVIVC